MAPSLEDNQYRLKTFLEDHPDIKYIPPTAPDFSSLSALYIQSSPTTPLAVVRPQTADHVASLVSFCTAHAIQFTVRTGGKNLFRLSSAQDALMIDMRDMNYVQIDAAKSSATVGGGVLQDKLAAELAKEGLVTPSGAFGFVGFVGWSTYGGYGPLASHYGLGLDNILGAKVVNAKGEVVVADKELLKCIRGAGGAFGVIIELTVKVYPLHRILCGVIIFDSKDIISAYEKFNAGYQRHIEDGAIPLELDVQQFVGNSSQGKALTVSIVWSSDDHEAGRASIAKIEALGTVVLNTIQSKTLAEYVAEMVLQLPPVMYGTCRTTSVRKWTTKTTEILSRGIQRMPSVVGTAFTLHELRGRSAAPNPDSVFAAREPHIMLEIISLVDKEENSKESEEWGISLRDEILQRDPENVLPGTYISVTPPGDVPLRKIYGPDANYQNLLDLKKKYDPQNVFSLAVPKLLES